MCVTLFNKVINPETDRAEYFRTYIYNADWQGELITNVNDKGFISADKITCFIPFSSSTEGGKKYVEPRVFNRMTVSERERVFTFNKNDIIVKGMIDFEITNENGHRVKDLFNDYIESGIIVSIIPHDYGSESMRHWEIGAK
ncbi:DUF6751 family protein [Clostridium baratii]|uniref:DUF6751 family protein n=1 Tax=Clostridium baratii TaxID=1561 RepID=UPI0030D4366F